MRDMTVVLKYEIPAIRNSDFLTGNYLSEFILFNQTLMSLYYLYYFSSITD
jgi:hypothetical protein